MIPARKIQISLAFFIILFLVSFILLIYPLLNKIKENSGNFTVQKKTLLGLEAKIKNLKNVQTLYRSYQPNLEKINELFINADEPLGFIEFLEQEADNASLSIEIYPSNPKKVNGDIWQSMEFQITLSGSFPNFLKFINKLEASPYLFETQNLSIQRLTENDVSLKGFEGLRAGDVSAVLRIKVYTR